MDNKEKLMDDYLSNKKNNAKIITLKYNNEIIKINTFDMQTMYLDNEGFTSSFINLFDTLRDVVNKGIKE